MCVWHTFWGAGVAFEHFWNLLAHWSAFHDSRHIGSDDAPPTLCKRSSASSKSALAAASRAAGASGSEAFHVTPEQKSFSRPVSNPHVP